MVKSQSNLPIKANFFIDLPPIYHLPIIYQLFTNHLPIIYQSFANHLPIIYHPSTNDLPISPNTILHGFPSPPHRNWSQYRSLRGRPGHGKRYVVKRWEQINQDMFVDFIVNEHTHTHIYTYIYIYIYIYMYISNHRKIVIFNNILKYYHITKKK